MARCPLLALSGHALVHRTCPLLGVKRTWFSRRKMSAYDLRRKVSMPVWSNPRRRDEIAHLRLLLDAPDYAQKIVDAISRQVLLRHQAELLFHFAVGHRILEVPAVIFDAHRLARAGFQYNLQLAQIEFMLGPVGFVRWQAFDAAHEIEQAWVVQIGILVVLRARSYRT